MRRLSLPLLLALVVSTGCRELVQRGPDAESMSIAPTVIEVPVNGTVAVVGTAFDGNGNTITGRTIRYSSANTAIATITEQGVVIGVSVGQTTVAASLSGKEARAQVTVVPERPATIEVLPSPVTLRRGNVRQFTATPKNNAGTPITGRTVQWSSSNASIASVSPQGEVTAVAPGNVVIAASVDNVTGSAQVTVTEIPIGSIALAPTARTIQVSETFQPSVTLRDTASNVISSLGRPLLWTSDNEVNATVSNSGVVTGRRAGSARITAASPDNPAINAFADFTVVDPVVKTMTITPRTGSLRLGIPRQLSAQLFDSLGRQITTGRQITWSSATTSTVSVNANGLVTGLALGTARIAAQVDDAVDTVTFQVTKIPVGSVELSPLQSNIFQGQTVQLTAIVEDSVGTEVTDRVVQWLTSDATRASVSGTGLVSAVAPGNVTITANSEGRTATASVVVLQVPADSVALVTPGDTAVSVGSTFPNNSKPVSLRILDAQGNELTGRNLLITSGNPSAATAQYNTGTRVLTIVGQAAGETTIELRALGQSGQPEGKTTRIRVTVN